MWTFGMDGHRQMNIHVLKLPSLCNKKEPFLVVIIMETNLQKGANSLLNSQLSRFWHYYNSKFKCMLACADLHSCNLFFFTFACTFNCFKSNLFWKVSWFFFCCALQPVSVQGCIALSQDYSSGSCHTRQKVSWHFTKLTSVYP
jgi:hypothetical protein